MHSGGITLIVNSNYYNIPPRYFVDRTAMNKISSENLYIQARDESSRERQYRDFITHVLLIYRYIFAANISYDICKASRVNLM